jgi:hypothetical protein
MPMRCVLAAASALNIPVFAHLWAFLKAPINRQTTIILHLGDF